MPNSQLPAPDTSLRHPDPSCECTPAPVATRPTMSSPPLSVAAAQAHESSRPRNLPRYPSYSKRHASFNSPREVPLPSPTLWQAEAPNPFLATASDQPQPSSSRAQEVFDLSPTSPPSPTRPRGFHSQQESEPQPIASSSRPQSPVSPTRLTHTHDDLNPTWRHRHHHMSSSSSAAPASPPHSPVSAATNRDIMAPAPRIPSGSNELPNNLSKENQPAPLAAQPSDLSPIYLSSRPFSLPDTQSSSYSNTLSSYLRQSPSASPSMSDRSSPAWIDRFSSASLPPPSQIPFYALPKVNPHPPSSIPSTDLDVRASSLSLTSSTQVASSGSGTSDASSDRSGLRCPPLDNESSSSSSGSSISGSVSTTSSSPNTESSFHAHVNDNKASPFPHPPRPTLDDAPPAPRATNAHPAAPLPPARAFSPPPFRAPQPPAHAQVHNSPALAEHTAIRRYVSQREPSAYPPPEPPVILPADTLSENGHVGVSGRATAPYIPFLSHAPPPPDSWIEVETTAGEYRLHVRLPGFSREGITLATKRRRILHVVADRWDNGGGHFERRISFGYDADLVQVRAEFDGVMLRITIPRRASPVMVTSSGRPGPIGRA